MLTDSYKYDGGAETEFLFYCKGRPFTAMVSKHLPTPTTLVDFHLVRDIGLKMSNIQCQKFTFGGYKMRILGHISTKVQTVQDGFASGHMQFNALVVLDLSKNLDTFSVCGTKMAEKLTACAAATAGPAAADVTTPCVRASWSPAPSPRPKRARPGTDQSPLRTSCLPPSPRTPPNASSSHSHASGPAAPQPQVTTSATTPPRSSPSFSPTTVPAAPPPRVSTTPPRSAASLSPTTGPAAPSATLCVSPYAGAGQTSRLIQRPVPRIISPPRSPPGFPTPMFMKVDYVPVQPRCLSVKEDYPDDEHPVFANLTVLDEVFGNADKLDDLREERALLARLYPGAKFHVTTEGYFRMETPDGLRYWSNHGEYKCDRSCFSIIGGGAEGVPNNCGWHRQWKFPKGFKPCGKSCRGGFCDCLDYYDQY